MFYRTKTIRLASIALIMTFSASSVAGADECRDVLSVAQNLVQNVDQSTFSKTVDWYVQRNTKKVQRDKKDISGSADVSLPLVDALLDFEASGSYQSEKVREWRDQFQSTGSVDIAENLFSLFSRTTVDQKALSVWSECMKTRDWEAEIDGDIYGDFAISLSWDGHPNIHPKLSQKIGATNSQPVQPLVFAHNLKFSKEDSQTQIFKRTNPTKPALITLNLSEAPNVVVSLPGRRQSAPVATWPRAFSPTVGVAYYLVARHSDKCVHVRAGSTGPVVDILQFKCEDQEHFRFLFEEISSGWFLIRRQNTQKCLHVRAASEKLGEPFLQADCESGHQFQFRITPSEAYKGYYSIKARHSSQCMHVEKASPHDRAAIEQTTCEDLGNLVFKFTDEPPGL